MIDFGKQHLGEIALLADHLLRLRRLAAKTRPLQCLFESSREQIKIIGRNPLQHVVIGTRLQRRDRDAGAARHVVLLTHVVQELRPG